MNPMIRISLCNRRTNRKYRNQEKLWSWVRDRNRIPVRTPETAEEYPKMTREQQAEAKDQGGFVGGWLKGGVRKNGNVVCRSLGALDADHVPEGVSFPAAVRRALPGIEWFIYSTHRHTPRAPRFRLVILFSREVSEEEYPPLMRMVAREIGIDFFDDSTYQANRMMYWASCPSDGEFVFEESFGQALPADRYLEKYRDWRDSSQWPTSSRQTEVITSAAAEQQDPLVKDGIVGTFCRTYFPIQEAMETFLKDIYAPTEIPGRWDYIPAESTAGVVVYSDRFVYSHHTTDPACGQLLNAFDLVRVHLFGDGDEKASYRKMAEFALSQEAVRLRLDSERLEQASADFRTGYPPPPDRGWTRALTYQARTGALNPTYENLMMIFRNDPDFRHFGWNEMASRVEVTGPLPWSRPAYCRCWRDADSAALLIELCTRYKTVFPARIFDPAFTKAADERRFHPVRDYLDALPEWDGTHRIEQLFQRCLRADDTAYVRAVARKLFAAAVARIYRPGTKFDSIVVLDGPQGIGKSTLLHDLAGAEYYTETLSLSDMSDKSGAEKLQGVWIAEISELAGMKKADIERVKAFLSTRDDSYRPSYGRTVESHPRSCVIIGTVNGDQGYLRDITGNRRFWVVPCRQQKNIRGFCITPEERAQIWAEAKRLYENNEPLYLEKELISEAEEIQTAAMEEDGRLGMVEAYLETLLPEDWERMDLFARRLWLGEENDPIRPKGVNRRDKVSNMEIWAECMGKNPADMKPSDSYAISALMTRLPGWDRSKKRTWSRLYGMQRYYMRTEKAEAWAFLA